MYLKFIQHCLMKRLAHQLLYQPGIQNRNHLKDKGEIVFYLLRVIHGRHKQPFLNGTQLCKCTERASFVPLLIFFFFSGVERYTNKTFQLKPWHVIKIVINFCVGNTLSSIDYFPPTCIFSNYRRKIRDS